MSDPERRDRYYRAAVDAMDWRYSNLVPVADAVMAVADDELARARRLSEAKIGGAALYVEQANVRSEMLEGALTAYEGVADERDRYRLAWTSARRRAKTAVGAWRHQQHTLEVEREERQEDGDVIRELVCMLTERSSRLRRYRLAWLSARRRAADDAQFLPEALTLKDAEIARLRAELDASRKSTYVGHLECLGTVDGDEVYRLKRS